MDPTEIGPGLRWVVEACRNSDDEALCRIAAGADVGPGELKRSLPAGVLADLENEGLVATTDEGLRHLSVSCVSVRGLVSLLPARQQVGADFVHLNGDSFWLIQLAWRHGSPGTWAAELGTGNGFIAAHLVAKYRRVIATDLPGPWMRYARMTLAANRGRGRPTGVIACDIASALRPGMFDLVVSNTPWSPNPGLDEDGNVQTFMDGGPTGTELPSRFIREAMDLLAPGGVAIMACLDTTFDDGSRPLQPVLDEVVDRGFGLEIEESPLFPPELITPSLRAERLPDLRHALHMAAVITRPARP